MPKCLSLSELIQKHKFKSNGKKIQKKKEGKTRLSHGAICKEQTPRILSVGEVLTPRKGDYLLSGIFESKGPKSEVAHNIRNNGEFSGLVFIAKDKMKLSLSPKSSV